MKFKDYVKMLSEYLDEHPEAAELEAVFAIDENRQDFIWVMKKPAMGILEDDYFQNMYDLFNLYDAGDYPTDKPNAICLN